MFFVPALVHVSLPQVNPRSYFLEVVPHQKVGPEMMSTRGSESVSVFGKPNRRCEKRITKSTYLARLARDQNFSTLRHLVGCENIHHPPRLHHLFRLESAPTQSGKGGGGLLPPSWFHHNNAPSARSLFRRRHYRAFPEALLGSNVATSCRMFLASYSQSGSTAPSCLRNVCRSRIFQHLAAVQQPRDTTFHPQVHIQTFLGWPSLALQVWPPRQPESRECLC